MLKEISVRAEREMKKAVEATVKGFNGVRTGRACRALLDGLMVEAYDPPPVPINQVASLAVPETRLITVQPWDTSLLPAIEKAILKSDLGVTPTNDGTLAGMPTSRSRERSGRRKPLRMRSKRGRT